MDSNILTEQIFDFIRNRITKPDWFNETENYWKELQITEYLLIDGTTKTTAKDENIQNIPRQIRKKTKAPNFGWRGKK